MSMRTQLERQADGADCALYQLIGRIEGMYERHENAQSALADVLRALRKARTPLRGLMHKTDRERTL